MKLSILPMFVAFVFVFCIAITRKARSNESINAVETRSVYLLLLTFLAWTLIAVRLGIRRTHVELMPHVPLLWRAFVPVILLSAAFTFSGMLRSGLRDIATSTPGHSFIFIQALRIGALGGIMNGANTDEKSI